MQYYTNSSNKPNDLYNGLLLVGLLIVIKAIESVCQRHWYFNSKRSGMRMRSALMAAIYVQKTAQAIEPWQNKASNGEIANYISVDAYRMGESFWWFHSAWSLLLQLFLSIGVLVDMLGLGALPGMVPLLILALCNVPIAKFLASANPD